MGFSQLDSNNFADLSLELLGSCFETRTLFPFTSLDICLCDPVTTLAMASSTREEVRSPGLICKLVDDGHALVLLGRKILKLTLCSQHHPGGRKVCRGWDQYKYVGVPDQRAANTSEAEKY